MKHKYVTGCYSTCPRLLCDNQPVLPIGLSDELNKSRVKVRNYYYYFQKAYCPKCEDAYYPKIKADIDGAYFGTSFPHMFLQTYPEFVPQQGSPPYIPRIYGFRISGLRGSKYEVSGGLGDTRLNVANSIAMGAPKVPMEDKKIKSGKQ